MSDKNKHTLKFVPKSTRAKDYHDNVYLPKMEKTLKEIEQLPLSIVIWGPDSSGESILYEKRVQILNELRKKGFDAFFSEEVKVEEFDHLPQKTQEFVQAMAADLIIILRCSYGSVAEFHDFSDYRKIAGKMYVFVDEQTKDSYSSQGAVEELNELYRKVESYKYPEDLKTCSLLAKILSLTRKIQHTKYRVETNAREWGV